MQKTFNFVMAILFAGQVIVNWTFTFRICDIETKAKNTVGVVQIGPLKVGDQVVVHTRRYPEAEVISIDGDSAWIKHFGDVRPVSANIKDLARLVSE